VDYTLPSKFRKTGKKKAACAAVAGEA